MAIRLYTGKRRKLKAERESGETFGFGGVMKHVNISIGEDYHIEIDRKDLIEAYEFLMKPRDMK
jgi:hypothetical protein